MSSNVEDRRGLPPEMFPSEWKQTNPSFFTGPPAPVDVVQLTGGPGPWSGGDLPDVAQVKRASDQSMFQRARQGGLTPSYGEEFTGVPLPGTMPFVGSGGATDIATRLTKDLMSELDLTREQALGLVGNLAHESAGFRDLTENGVGGNGGYGYAQWTGDRRTKFETWAKSQGLKPSSYEANKGFIVKELLGSERGALKKIKAASTADQAASVAMSSYFRPGVPHLDSRQNWTNQFAQSIPNNALAAIDAVAPTLPARRPDSIANPSGGLVSRPVQTIPIRPTAPITAQVTAGRVGIGPVADLRGSVSLANPSQTWTKGGAGQAGTVQMPRNVEPSIMQTARPQMAAAMAAIPRAPVVPAKPAISAMGRSVAQIGQEADNARLSGYRQIQEMGPSSKGAKATIPTVAPRVATPSVVAAKPTSGTVYYPKSPGTEYGYNSITGDYEVKSAGQPYASVPAPKFQVPAPSAANPTPKMPNGLPTLTGSRATPATYSASMRFATPNAGQSSGVLRLNSEPMSEVSGQNIANSRGAPVQGPSGKVYYPSNVPQSGVRSPMRQAGSIPAVPQRQGGGLFGALFGGGNSSGNSGGIFSGLFGGTSASPSLASRQTAPYAPGTTFEQRAAAAAAREALMNPPTETNWAAIEASAKNRR